MLDVRRLRENFEEIKEILAHRDEELGDLDKFEELDRKRRVLIRETEQLKNVRNEVTKKIAELKREKKNADELILEMRTVGDKIKAFDDELREVEQELQQILLQIPNIPHESVPIGKDENDNVEVRKWGDL